MCINLTNEWYKVFVHFLPLECYNLLATCFYLNALLIDFPTGLHDLNLLNGFSPQTAHQFSHIFGIFRFSPRLKRETNALRLKYQRPIVDSRTFQAKCLCSVLLRNYNVITFVPYVPFEFHLLSWLFQSFQCTQRNRLLAFSSHLEKKERMKKMQCEPNRTELNATVR